MFNITFVLVYLIISTLSTSLNVCLVQFQIILSKRLAVFTGYKFICIVLK